MLLSSSLNTETHTLARAHHSQPINTDIAFIKLLYLSFFFYSMATSLLSICVSLTHRPAWAWAIWWKRRKRNNNSAQEPIVHTNNNRGIREIKYIYKNYDTTTAARTRTTQSEEEGQADDVAALKPYKRSQFVQFQLHTHGLAGWLPRCISFSGSAQRNSFIWMETVDGDERLLFDRAHLETFYSQILWDFLFD